ILALRAALWPKGATSAPAAELLEELLQVWIYNSFDLSEDGKEAGAIFLCAAMQSHSCAPNAAWHLDENNSFILHARSFIEEGQERDHLLPQPRGAVPAQLRPPRSPGAHQGVPLQLQPVPAAAGCRQGLLLSGVSPRGVGTIGARRCGPGLPVRPWPVGALGGGAAAEALGE
ncbi:unnamed protein product, partial [Effrenium voratum]